MKNRIDHSVWIAIACLCAVLAGPAFAQSTADARIGVVQFETAGPPDADFPDVATMLADRMASLGAEIVGPKRLSAAANAAPDDATVTQWASGAKVDVIVVGRTTQIGGQLSIDVRLRSGSTGKPVATYVGEVGRGGQLASVVESLAGQVLEGTLELWASSHKPVPAVSAKPKPSTPARVFDNDKPISIKSKTLEATDVDGRRRLEFTGDVRVTQDDVSMTSNSLTAVYPTGSSQPSEMVARGSVRVRQKGQEIRCDTGTYKRAEATLMCCGSAELRDGANRVRGSCIEFDLEGDSVRVQDATIQITPETEGGTGGAGGS